MNVQSCEVARQPLLTWQSMGDEQDQPVQMITSISPFDAEEQLEKLYRKTKMDVINQVAWNTNGRDDGMV